MKESNDQASPLTPEQWAAYEWFLSAYRPKLRTISYRTLGEFELGDVESEAILLAAHLRSRLALDIDFRNPAFIETLLSRLYQKLVKYSRNPMRFAIRLDHGIGDDPDEPHPLANKLASDGGRDPLDLLIERQAQLQFADMQSANLSSLAAAYVHLLEHFNYQMVRVAEHRLLTLGETNRHIAWARVLARRQHPLRMPLPSKTFVPGPWKKFRLMRMQVQLTLDLGEQVALDLRHS